MNANADADLEILYSEELYSISAKPAIVLTKAWSDLTTAEKEQLTKITEAIRKRLNPKLRLDAFQVIHVESLNLGSWREKPEKMIYFGPVIKGLTPYEVIEAEGTKMVLSDSLSDIIPNEQSRTKLWQALQQLFMP